MAAMANDDAIMGTRALEALLFVSDEPLPTSVIAQALEIDRSAVERLCERLTSDLEERGAGVVLRNVAGGWRLFTHPDTAPEVERFVQFVESSGRGVPA